MLWDHDTRAVSFWHAAACNHCAIQCVSMRRPLVNARAPTTLVTSLLHQLEAKNESGRAAIHYASSKGHTAVVEALLTAKCDVNEVDERGVAPLHLAAGRGNAKMITLLLASKANVNQRCVLHPACLLSSNTTASSAEDRFVTPRTDLCVRVAHSCTQFHTVADGREPLLTSPVEGMRGRTRLSTKLAKQTRSRWHGCFSMRVAIHAPPTRRKRAPTMWVGNWCSVKSTSASFNRRHAANRS